MSGDTAVLLDVNVLFALHLPQHVHYAAAHRWFSQQGARRWATCAITQTGFLRLSLNPRITGQSIDFNDALDRLRQATAAANHEYWEALPAANCLTTLDQTLVQGHKQMTDAYLLNLARHNRGCLATFDSGVATLIPRPSQRKRWVELILP